jgi:hypothetical protein
MKTVEDLIAILQTLPPKSRVIVGDDDEGTIKEVADLVVSDSKYYKRYERNDSPVVELTVEKMDEFWDSWVEEFGEDPREKRMPKEFKPKVEKIPREIGFYTNEKTPAEVKEIYEFMHQKGYVIIGAEVNGEFDQRDYLKGTRKISVKYFYRLQDADFMEEPVYRCVITAPGAHGSVWILGEDPVTKYLERVAY